MDINHAPAKPRDRGGRNPLQVTSEHDEPGAAGGCHHLVRIVGVREHRGGHPRPPRALERARIGAARDHAGNAGYGRVAQRVEQRLKVRAVARNEHGHGNRRHRLQGASERGFVPGTTLSVYAPVANRSLLVTTMK